MSKNNELIAVLCSLLVKILFPPTSLITFAISSSAVAT